MSTVPQAVDARGSQPIEGVPVEPAAFASGPGEAGRLEGSERHWQGIDPRLRQDWRQVSAEEWRSRHEEYKRAIAEIDAQDETPDEVYDEVLRNIDEERRRQGRPPAFEGCY